MKGKGLALALLAAFLLYVVSLTLPAFECGTDRPFFRFAGSDDPLGVLILGFGWLGLMVGEVRWLTNLPFLIMVVHLACPRWKMRLVYPVAAAPLALSCVFIPARACGASYDLSHSLAIGGYLWVTAVLAVSLIYTLQLTEQSRLQSAS